MTTKGLSSTQSQVPSFGRLTRGCQSFRQMVQHCSALGLRCLGRGGVKGLPARVGMTELHDVQLFCPAAL